jgi:hypothetical protein
MNRRTALKHLSGTASALILTEAFSAGAEAIQARAAAPTFVFGIYPGGDAGSNDGIVTGFPDDPVQICRCLDDLQGGSHPFIVRSYERFSDREHPSRWPVQQPAHYEQYLENGRMLDLVLLFQSIRGDVAGYLQFAVELVKRHASKLYSVQVTEEASSANGPDVIDGPYPNVLNALVEGVKEVKHGLRQIGRHDVRVGFNATPTFGPDSSFWSKIGKLGGGDFLKSLDYVGLDFFPDVFRRLAPDGEPGDLERSARGVLQTMRNEWLPAAGIGPSVPIHIAEHGWPTAPARSEERQAEVIEKIIRLLWAERKRLNIARYTLFDLRDATAPGRENDLFRHFGITRGDYSAKAAYATFRSLIREYGASAA